MHKRRTSGVSCGLPVKYRHSLAKHLRIFGTLWIKNWHYSQNVERWGIKIDEEITVSEFCKVDVSKLLPGRAADGESVSTLVTGTQSKRQRWPHDDSEQKHCILVPPCSFRILSTKVMFCQLWPFFKGMKRGVLRHALKLWCNKECPAIREEIRKKTTSLSLYLQHVQGQLKGRWVDWFQGQHQTSLDKQKRNKHSPFRECIQIIWNYFKQYWWNAEKQTHDPEHHKKPSADFTHSRTLKNHWKGKAKFYETQEIFRVQTQLQQKWQQR